MQSQYLLSISTCVTIYEKSYKLPRAPIVIIIVQIHVCRHVGGAVVGSGLETTDI